MARAVIVAEKPKSSSSPDEVGVTRAAGVPVLRGWAVLDALACEVALGIEVA
jgi:hypothetical protein